jgi:formiminotetrahydrofolate cyclodeaminase
VGAPDFFELRVRELADEVAARTAAPGGGSVAALVLALAAALTEMAARFADGHWTEAQGAAAQASALRRRAEPLARKDAEAYTAALEALRRPRGADPEERDRALGDALSDAAEVPLEIATVAADVAALAADVAERGNPNLYGDAIAAAILAEAAARVGANLVAINLTMTEEDQRVAGARAHADAAARSTRRAITAGT